MQATKKRIFGLMSKMRLFSIYQNISKISSFYLDSAPQLLLRQSLVS